MTFFTASAAVMISACPALCPSPWPGRAGHQFLARDDARRLVRARQAVDVGAERDDRMARPVPCDPRRWHAGHRPLHVESFAHQHVGEVALRLDFLEPQLAIAEQLIDHLLREHAPRFDVGDDFLLQRFGLLGRRCELDRRRAAAPVRCRLHAARIRS